MIEADLFVESCRKFDTDGLLLIAVRPDGLYFHARLIRDLSEVEHHPFYIEDAVISLRHALEKNGSRQPS